jgi:hypothetical protein
MVTITNLKNKIWEGHQPHMRGSVYFGTLSQLISKIITTSINLAESQIRKKSRQCFDIAVDVAVNRGVNRAAVLRMNHRGVIRFQHRQLQVVLVGSVEPCPDRKGFSLLRVLARL